MDARLQRRGHSLTPHDVSPRSFQLVARLLTTTGNGFAGKRKEKKKKKKKRDKSRLHALSSRLPSRIELIPSRNDFNLNRSSLSTDPYSRRQINTNIKRAGNLRNVAKWEIVIEGGFRSKRFSNSNPRIKV